MHANQQRLALEQETALLQPSCRPVGIRDVMAVSSRGLVALLEPVWRSRYLRSCGLLSIIIFQWKPGECRCIRSVSSTGERLLWMTMGTTGRQRAAVSKRSRNQHSIDYFAAEASSVWASLTGYQDMLYYSSDIYPGGDDWGTTVV